jgi:hypothetical protein
VSTMTRPGEPGTARALRPAEAARPGGGDVVKTRFSLSGDLWLRISLELTRLLLTARVPLPGFQDTGPFATFRPPSRPQGPFAQARCDHWHGGLRPAGGTT